jgi:hypothetical protein
MLLLQLLLLRLMMVKTTMWMESWSPLTLLLPAVLRFAMVERLGCKALVCLRDIFRHHLMLTLQPSLGEDQT